MADLSKTIAFSQFDFDLIFTGVFSVCRYVAQKHRGLSL